MYSIEYIHLFTGDIMAKVNWTDKDQVINYARNLGSGMTVYKHPSRKNYNITHTSRTDLYHKDWVVFNT